jgi:hypothetical protein
MNAALARSNEVAFVTAFREQALGQFIDAIRENALIASPFVGRQPVELLCHELERRLIAKSVKLCLLTNLSPASLQYGTSDPQALILLLETLPNAQVRHLGGLHAKVYVADSRMALVTSANFTEGGIARNYEFGVSLLNTNHVRVVRKHLEAYIGLSASLQLDQLRIIADATEQTRSLSTRAQKTVDRDINQALDKVRGQLFQARLRTAEAEAQTEKRLAPKARPTSENQIFASTILHLLAHHGTMTTREMHPLIQALHPDLCDDDVDRVIDGVHFGRRWKHMVRNAQQYLKRAGKIVYNGKYWRPKEQT